MQIGALARATGVPVQTIRYYETRGLLSPDTRKVSGYRLYDAEAVAQLRFIRRAQALGFTLSEVGELLALRQGKTANAPTMQQRAAAKIAQIDAKLEDLGRIRTALASLMTACRHDGPASAPCTLLTSLGEHAPSRAATEIPLDVARAGSGSAQRSTARR